MKKRLLLPGIIVLLFALFTQFTFAVDSGSPDISLNNSPINAKAHIAEGNLYLPVRAICESLGYNVEWLQADKTVEITSDGTLILLNFNKLMIEVNNHDYYMTEERITINDRIYMRSDFFTENFDLSIKWDKTDGKISLNSIKANPISIRTIKETSENSELKVTLQYPQIDGLENKLVQDEINALFKQLAENAAKEGAKNAAELAEYAKEHPDGSPNSCETYFNYHVKYNQNNILSLVLLNYQYAKGSIMENISPVSNMRIGRFLKSYSIFSSRLLWYRIIFRAFLTPVTLDNSLRQDANTLLHSPFFIS
jgi:uncharacterized short protein YbdD (DUF466 family)